MLVVIGTTVPNSIGTVTAVSYLYAEVVIAHKNVAKYKLMSKN